MKLAGAVLALCGAGLVWLAWEVTQALPAQLLPASRRCAYCGEHMTDEDRWLEENGARVQSIVCDECDRQLGGV